MHSVIFVLCIVILLVCLQLRVDNDVLNEKLDKILKQLNVENNEEE